MIPSPGGVVIVVYSERSGGFKKKRRTEIRDVSLLFSSLDGPRVVRASMADKNKVNCLILFAKILDLIQ